LQAKVIPDSDGNIGIYSADPSLYGNISYGSDTDQATVQRARVNSPKNNLLFGLPRPIVKDTAGNTVGSSRFVLQGNTLQVVASGLSSTKTPVTIDPSVVVTSASDFGNGNNEDNIDFSTSGQITRGVISGGTVGSWTATSAFTQPSQGLATAVYNGYMYILSGGISSGAVTSSVQYAPLNANGTVGTWHYTHNSTDDGTTFVSGFSGTRSNFGIAVYNGYLYIAGGGGGGSVFSDVQYAPLNANGTVGTWTSTTSMSTARSSFGFGAYNGYVYAYGGCTSVSLGVCSGYSKTLGYAPINANGTIGTWTTSGNNMTTTRINMESAIYNGYLYAMGGCVSISLGNCTSQLSSVEYAPINSDGTVGSWKATTSFTTSRQNFGAVATNGYLYIMGGSTTLNDVQYAPIYANGALGTWSTTTTFTTARSGLAVTASGGYLYLAGGCSSAVTNCGSGLMNDVQYAKLNPVGPLGDNSTGQYVAMTNGYDNQTRGATGTFGQCAVANGGYLYVIGGDPSGSNVGSKTIRYAALNSDGTVGTWAATTQSLLTNRELMGCTVYNGYLYVAGGETNGSGVLYYNTVEYAPLAATGNITTAFTTGTAFTTAGSSSGRAELQAVAYNGYLYILGGRFNNNSTLSSDIQYIQIGTNGALSGSWTATTAQMPNNNGTYPVGGRAQFGAVAYAGRMYIVGGNSAYGTTGPTDVYVGSIGSTGNIASFTLSTSLTAPHINLGIAVSKGFLYVFGGASGGVAGSHSLSDTQYAQIDSTTGLITGSWQATISSINNTGVYYPSSVIGNNGYIYQIGGCTSMATLGVQNPNNASCDSNAAYNTVQYAPLNNGGPGTVGSWNSATSLPISTVWSTSIAYNGYVYEIGGFQASSNVATVYYAAINSNGTLGSWSTTTSLPVALRQSTSIAYNGYVYEIGGYNGSSAVTTVYYAAINSNGTLGSWSTTTSLPVATSGATSAVYNGYVYEIGGLSSATVYYAAINSNGTLGSWSTTTSLPVATAFATSVAMNGYVYEIGGYNTSYFATVYYAAINSNGTLGSWSTTTSLPETTGSAISVAYNGYIYEMGGWNGSAYVATVYYAAINSNGTLGSWSTTTSLPGNLDNASSVVYNGYVYEIGGDINSTGSATVSYAPLQSIPHIAHYSKLIDLGSIANVTGVTFNGTAGGGVNVSYRAAGADGVFGTSTPVSNISGSGCTSNVTSTRYLLLTVTLDDSYGQGTSGAFPDSSGTPANLTDLTVNYNTGHPPPNIRLRGGQTLQAGVLSPLDTCS
jgi:hypothetical protein